MALTFLASFPNSRNFPRPATKIANTFTAVLPVGVSTSVIPANQNRTYATLRNDSAVDDLRFYYRHAGDPAPTLADILNDGFLLEAGDAYQIDSPEEIYAATNGGAPISLSIDEGEG